MMTPSDQNIRAAEIVLPCAAIEETLGFFRQRLGFRLETIFPADSPRVAVISGHGLRLRLDSEARGDAGAIRLLCADPSSLAGGERRLVAPNGTRIAIVPAETPVVVPPLEPRFVLTRMGAGEGGWGAGRAGMFYRDLVPDRLGGGVIASHILIRDGGPVPDYVHYHKIRFQMIYCRTGWVRLVYEDQGPPFLLEAGDCVLQPPEIRHRVLESSPGLEVVEIGCPAVHETFADNAMALPNDRLEPERDFSGQRFLRHVAARAVWQPWRAPGFLCRDTGIAAATNGLAGALVVRPDGARDMPPCSHAGEFRVMFVLDGAARLRCSGEHRLGPADAFVIPAGMRYALEACSTDLSLLEVALPAAVA